MTPEEHAAFMEILEALGAERVRGWLEAFAVFTDRHGEFRDPSTGDVLVRPLTEDDVREYFEVLARGDDEMVKRLAEQPDVDDVCELLRHGREARLERALRNRPGPKTLSSWDVVEAAAKIAIDTAKKRKHAAITEIDISNALRVKSLCDELHIERSALYELLKRHTSEMWLRLVRSYILVRIYVSNSAAPI